VKQKIINDPIYGFITIPGETTFRIIEHPYMQRLRRIRQLGMTHLVYPGANHTRFHHALGSMHLMMQAIDILRTKGHSITDEEKEAVIIAILLHDVGHGPFSHTLEESIVDGIRHEELSELIMDRLNGDFNGSLSLAIKIFRGDYAKKFLHQLVSSQLDMDRLDYLNRDSFFTGVSEGVISSDRIIKMLAVHNDTLAIEAKGIYSIEKFIVARRLMYWQVYLHKTVVAAEKMLISILKRAKELLQSGEELFCTPALKKFMQHNYTIRDFRSDDSLLDVFAQLDDSDITASVKVWHNHPDFILSTLCKSMMHRHLFRIEIQNAPFPEMEIQSKRDEIKSAYKMNDDQLHYFLLHGKLVNNAYKTDTDKINILFKDGSVKDIASAADTLNIQVMSEPVEKYYLCYPKYLHEGV
jgi:HD superfamily phosphohydrolase